MRHNGKVSSLISRLTGEPLLNLFNTQRIAERRNESLGKKCLRTLTTFIYPGRRVNGQRIASYPDQRP